MKLMKRFTLLIAVAMVLTVGGVYANWVYSANEDVLAERTINPEMSAILLEGGLQGSIVDLDSDVILKIDDKTYGTTNDHLTGVVVEGDIIFLYKPDTGAAGYQRTPLKWIIKENSPTKATYTPVDGTATTIFSTAQEAKEIDASTGNTDTHIAVNTADDLVAPFGDTDIDWSAHYSADTEMWLIKISSEDLNSAITMTEFKLSTVEEYYAFEQSILTATFKVGISTNADYLATWAGTVSTAIE